MFRFTCTTPATAAGHIQFKKDPAYYGVGFYEDNVGRTWDVRGIYGRDFVQARPVDNHYIYSTTPGLQSYTCSWNPYTYEILEGRSERTV